MHLLLSSGHHLGQHPWAHCSLWLGKPAKAAQEIAGQVRVLALEGQRLCQLLPQAWVPPESEGPNNGSITEVSAEWWCETFPSQPAESSQGCGRLQPADWRAAASLSEECTANGFALEEEHLEEEEIRKRCIPCSPEEFGVLRVPLTPLSVVRAEGKAMSGRGKKWKSSRSCSVNQYCMCFRDCCKGKTLSLNSRSCVVELNCAFLDQARVLLGEHQLNSALECEAEGQPPLGG